MSIKLAVALTLCIGCGDNTQVQVLTGRVAPGFPTAIASVKVMRGTSVIGQSSVGPDGSFMVYAAPSAGLSLHLIGSGSSAVVFPRQTNTVDRTFAIRGAGQSFDLGMIRFVGASTGKTFAFGHMVGTCDDDGHDATGATCVDDGDNHQGMCDGGDNQDGDNQEGDHQEGDQSTPDTAGADGADDADTTDQGDAVAEHNFPADGCADGNDNGGDMMGEDGGADGGGEDH